MTQRTPREAFLEAIKEDRFNQLTRLVFADWLEENGNDADIEEIQKQRLWTREWQEAEDFLQHYASALCTTPEDEEFYGTRKHITTLDEVLKVAAAHLRNRNGSDRWNDYIGIPFQTPDIVYEKRAEFWKHYRIYTRSEEVPEGYKGTFVSCGC